MSLNFMNRISLGAMWPMLSLGLFKQGQEIAKYKSGAKSGRGLEIVAALPAVAGVLTTLLLDGSSPIESIATFYAAAAVTAAFLDKIAGVIGGADARTAVNVFMFQFWQSKYIYSMDTLTPGKAVAGPTATGKFNTASNYDKNIVMPRYPFASGHQYALHNDNGQTWAETRMQLFH